MASSETGGEAAQQRMEGGLVISPATTMPAQQPTARTDSIPAWATALATGQLYIKPSGSSAEAKKGL